MRRFILLTVREPVQRFVRGEQAGIVIREMSAGTTRLSLTLLDTRLFLTGLRKQATSKSSTVTTRIAKTPETGVPPMRVLYEWMVAPGAIRTEIAAVQELEDIQP